MEYTIKDPNEDPKQAVIEKKGVLVHFTLREIEQQDAQYKKNIIELQAKHDYEAAKMKNIEEHHPFVIDMSAEDLFTCYLYGEAQGLVKACDQKLEEIRNQLAEDELESAEILKQLPELAPKVEATDEKPSEAKEA